MTDAEVDLVAVGESGVTGYRQPVGLNQVVVVVLAQHGDHLANLLSDMYFRAAAVDSITSPHPPLLGEDLFKLNGGKLEIAIVNCHPSTFSRSASAPCCWKKELTSPPVMTTGRRFRRILPRRAAIFRPASSSSWSRT